MDAHTYKYTTFSVYTHTLTLTVARRTEPLRKVRMDTTG